MDKDNELRSEAEAQATFDAVQKEKEELGIVTPEVVAEPEVKEPEPKVETPVEPEVKPEADELDENGKPKQVSVRDFKDFKVKLREEMQKDFDEKLEKIKQESAKPDEKKTENLEDEVKALAKELDFDEEKVRKIIEVARKGVGLTPEQQKILNEYESDKKSRQADAEAKEQQAILDTEWQSVTPTLKQQFPNASPEQLAKARETMDELATSEKYHETEMDYILFKENETFEKILFSPKMKTFESGRLAPTHDDSDKEFPEFNPNMTPAQFEAFEKRREKMMDDSPKEKMILTTRDDFGRVVQREV